LQKELSLYKDQLHDSPSRISRTCVNQRGQFTTIGTEFGPERGTMLNRPRFFNVSSAESTATSFSPCLPFAHFGCKCKEKTCTI